MTGHPPNPRPLLFFFQNCKGILALSCNIPEAPSDAIPSLPFSRSLFILFIRRFGASSLSSWYEKFHDDIIVSVVSASISLSIMMVTQQNFTISNSNPLVLGNFLEIFFGFLSPFLCSLFAELQVS